MHNIINVAAHREAILWSPVQAGNCCVPYLLIAMAMMTGSQPEYSSSRVDGILLAISTHRGHRATNTAHTSGLA